MTSGTPASAAAVLGMGASCAIGYGVRSIQLAMAGGLRNFQEGTLINDEGEPARIATLPDLDEAAPRHERIAALTGHATVDLVKQLRAYLPPRIPVHVGTAANAPESDLDAIIRALRDGAGGLIDVEASSIRVSRTGRIAFLSALATAIQDLDDGRSEVALVVAADTRCTWNVIDALMRQRRLLTNQDDGTIPGEGAVVALVASPRSASAIQHARFLVENPAFAQDEFQTIRQSPQAARGLGLAFRTLHERSVAGRPAAVIGFETGELFFTRAFATGYLRNAGFMPEPLRHEAIAGNVGDTGAAAAGLAIARADWMMQRQEIPGSGPVIVYGHADDGRCAATVAVGPQEWHNQ